MTHACDLDIITLEDGRTKCHFCGRAFHRPPSRSQRFCSGDCYWDWVLLERELRERRVRKERAAAKRERALRRQEKAEAEMGLLKPLMGTEHGG